MNMPRRVFLACLSLVAILMPGAARAADKIRVACVGDSITFGAGVKDREKNCYPVVLGGLLGEGHEVRNFGVSGATLLKNGDKPYWKEKAFKAATDFKPNMVLIKLGTNDTKPQNWKHKDQFAGDLKAMIEHFQTLDSKPVVHLIAPVPAFPSGFGITDDVIREGVIPIVKDVAKAQGLMVIDLYAPMKDKKELFPDKIHPNADGAKLMAQFIHKALKDAKDEPKKASAIPSATSAVATANEAAPAKPADKKDDKKTDKKDDKKAEPPAPKPEDYQAPAKVEDPKLPAGYKLVYQQNFVEANAIEQFAFTDPKVFRIARDGKDRDVTSLEHVPGNSYKYKVRSPFNIALIKTLRVGSFVLDADLCQNAKEYGHRDACVFYGFQNRSQFYYTHVATKSDNNAHQCFIVDNKDRTKISKSATPGFNWGERTSWHHLRVVRDIDTGVTEIYMDDMSKPIMTAQDKTFGVGYVGFGSFDDTGKVTNIRLWAPATQPGEAGREFFKD